MRFRLLHVLLASRVVCVVSTRGVREQLSVRQRRVAAVFHAQRMYVSRHNCNPQGTTSGEGEVVWVGAVSTRIQVVLGTWSSFFIFTCVEPLYLKQASVPLLG